MIDSTDLSRSPVMKYADFMAFPISPHELMAKEGALAFDSDIVLDVCHTTSVPPTIREPEEIIREHTWMSHEFASQEGEHPSRCFYGLPHPPEHATLPDLERMREAGIFFSTLGYEVRNMYGGGFAVPTIPLSGHGKELLENMAEANMILDLSHAGHATARDALAYIDSAGLSLRVVATHTACHAIYDHPRNLPDDILREIRDRGGMVGLVTVTWMLDLKNNSLDPFLTHLAHLIDTIGEDNAVLGTDGVYQRMNEIEALKRFKTMKEKFDPYGNFRVRHPKHPAELNRSDRMLVLEEIITARFGSAITEKIIGANLIRYLTAL